MFFKQGILLVILTIATFSWSEGNQESFKDFVPLSIKEKADSNWIMEYENQLKELSLKTRTSNYALLLTRNLLAFEELFPEDPKKAASLFHDLAEESDLLIKKGIPVIKANIKTNLSWNQSKSQSADNLHSWGKASEDFIYDEILKARKKGLPYQLSQLKTEYPELSERLNKEIAKADKKAAKIADKTDKKDSKDAAKADKTAAKEDKKETKDTDKTDKKPKKDKKEKEK